jgi:predicted RNase H-like HicB family nuclease
MATPFILSDYLRAATAAAEYDRLDDGSFAGRIPGCTGVIAFAATLRGCEEELRSVLEGWVFVGLKLGHRLPVIDGVRPHEGPEAEPMGTV